MMVRYDHFRLTRGCALIKFIVSSALALCVSQAASASVRMHTKDTNGVTLGCKGGEFIVSLNNDDDDGNKKPDLKAKTPSAQEDNLRQITLTVKGAKFVTLNPLSKKRIRAFHTDKKTPVVFQASYPVPLTFYAEGIISSKKMQDFHFDYLFIGAAGEQICAAKALGTVVNPNATFETNGPDRKKFDTSRKMLITSGGLGKSKWKPLKAPTVTWAYDGTAALTPKKATKHVDFAAGLILTGAANLNGDELKATITHKGQVIEAHTPINITAPVHAMAFKGWTNGNAKSTKPFDANKGYVGLFNSYVKYNLLDQFRSHIKESARSGKNIQVRENIRAALTSPLPLVQNWITNQLRATDNWKNKNNGIINDRLRVQKMPKKIMRIAQGTARFHPNLLQNGAALMNVGANTHQWSASVDGNLPTIVTDNTFTVTVLQYNPRPNHPRGPSISLTSTYGVVVR